MLTDLALNLLHLQQQICSLACLSTNVLVQPWQSLSTTFCLEQVPAALELEKLQPTWSIAGSPPATASLAGLADPLTEASLASLQPDLPASRLQTHVALDPEASREQYVQV